jgi:dimethylhistidine N-methyltransferase
VHAAALVPQLVPAALSVRLRRAPAGAVLKRAQSYEAARATPPTPAARESRPAIGSSDDLAQAVRAGLGRDGQKTLPSRFLYDALGSALFEAIGFLPEYGLTRADERILARCAPEIAALLPGPIAVAELGAGSGRKTRHVLAAIAAQRETTYFPIDVSPSALERCRAEMSSLERVRIETLEADYLEGLRRAAGRRTAGERLLVMFVGSTIGNFDPPAAGDFLRAVRGTLSRGDALLLGADLVKPASLVIAAYDDALGVTAAFDKNLLVRINRELKGDFDLTRFSHEARWNAGERRVEMHLVARDAHAVTIGALGMTVAFRAGESIWTESSYKFERVQPAAMAHEAGFECVCQWTDPEWPFAEALCLAR